MQTIDSILDCVVSTYQNAQDTIPRGRFAREVLDDIQNGKYSAVIETIRDLYERVLTAPGHADLAAATKAASKAVNQLKTQLPAVSFSVVSRKRNRDSTFLHTGILCADLDKIGAHLPDIRSVIERDPFVLAVFLSPTAAGLKVFFRIPEDSKKHIAAFRAVARHVRKLVNIEIDQACKDECRLCFVSYDPHLYINEEVNQIEILPEDEAPTKAQPKASPSPSPEYRESRSQIATRLLGEIRWDSETHGFCTCPGKDRHSTGSNLKECAVYLNGVPTIKCMHNSCEAVVRAFNAQLRSEIGKAEFVSSKHEPPPPMDDPLPGNEDFPDAEEADFHSNGEHAKERTSRPFTLWNFQQFLKYDPPPGYQLILPAHLSKGDFASIIGPSGVGKSRYVLRMAIAQILSKSFCGLQMSGDPVGWVLLGNENSIVRWKADLERIVPTLSDEESALVLQYLRIQAILTMDDGFICLDDHEARLRLTDSAADAHAGVVVLDPFGNYHPGDPNSTGEVRQTLRIIQKCLHKVDPLIIPLVLHHARAGRANMAQGVGNYEAGNFGFGAKAIHAACRNVFHLLPGDNEDSNKLVLSCGKASNCRKFEPRGLMFDDVTCDYRVDTSFNLQDWKDDIEGKLRGQVCSVADIVKLIKSGVRKTSDIVDSLRDRLGVSERTVKARIAEAESKEFIENLFRGMWGLGKRPFE